MNKKGPTPTQHKPTTESLSEHWKRLGLTVLGRVMGGDVYVDVEGEVEANTAGICGFTSSHAAHRFQI